jgi:hypothetical protein
MSSDDLLLTWAKPAQMIFIDNSEHLLSTALRNRVKDTYPGVSVWPLRTSINDPAPDLKKYIHEDRLPYPFVKYFLISEYPFNVYEVYDQMKAILRSLGALPLQRVSLHVVMKLNRDDVFMLKNIRSQCAHLRRLFTDLCKSLPAAPSLLFSCVYNVFGVVDTAVLHPDSNDVQSLLFQLQNPERYVVVPFEEKEEIYGTDVHAAVLSILEREGRLHVAHGEDVMVLPVNAPVQAGTLMAEVAKKRPDRQLRYLSNEYVTPSQVRAELAPRNLPANLAERFLAYLD